MSTYRRVLAASVLIVAATLAAYANSFSGEFLFDDSHSIVDNPHIRRLWPLSYALSAPDQSSLAGRPIVSLSFALNHACTGMSRWGFHAGNLFIHTLAALVLFGVVRRAFLRTAAGGLQAGTAAASGDAALTWLAGLIAALWAVHPLQTESVTYLVQRAESLMGLFYLLTLYLSARSFDAGRPIPWQAAAVLSCALGMGCKESMVTAPVAVVLYDSLLVSGGLRIALRRRRLFYAALFSTWLILALVLAGRPRSETVGFSISGVSSLQYAATQFGVIAHYLRLAFWPHPLCIDYAWPVAASARDVLPAAMLLLALLALTIRAAARRSPWAIAGAWVFLTLAPTSSVVPIQDLAFEHRMYLPLAGVLAAVVCAAAIIAQRGREAMPASRRVLRIASPLVALVLIAAAIGGTLRRNRDYADALRIWTQVVEVAPFNARAHSGIATALAARGDYAGAKRACEEALRANPRAAEAPFELARSFAQAGRLDEAEAAYRQALRIAPDHYRARSNLGELLARTGRAEEAIEQSRLALQARPDQAIPRRNLALALLSVGRPADAVEVLQAWPATTPQDAAARCELGTALARLGRMAEAEAAYREALAMDPENADAHCNLGVVLARQGRTADAERKYLDALALNPRHVAARYNLARALIAQGRTIDARRELEEVLNLDPRHAAARQALDLLQSPRP